MAKIVSMTPTGQWQDLSQVEIRFDNGDFGTAFAKSPTPSYGVGDEVEYTKNEKGYSQNPTPLWRWWKFRRQLCQYLESIG
jgi:hypothetical protein